MVIILQSWERNGRCILEVPVISCLRRKLNSNGCEAREFQRLADFGAIQIIQFG